VPIGEFLRCLHHNTPNWVGEGALFHVRVRIHAAQPPCLVEPAIGIALMEAAQRYHRLGHWWCELFLLMPDHIHALLRFPREPGIALVVGNWKRGTTRFQKIK